MKDFLKDRSDAFSSGDKEKICAYCKKYNIPIPKDEELFWIGVHKAICNLYLSPSTTITIEQYVKSYDYLKKKGFSPVIGDRIKHAYESIGKK